MANTNQHPLPEFRIYINGADLPAQAAADLTSVAIYEDLDAPSMFTLYLVNWDMNRLRVTWSDDALFAVGNEVELQMGYLDQMTTLLIGEITGLEPEFCADMAPMLTVRGYDRRHRLLRSRKTRTFTQMKDSEIANQLAGEAGLTAQVQDTRVIFDYVLQHNQTDLAFLRERAHRIGNEVVVEDKTLTFRPRRHDQGEIVTLARDVDLIEFLPRLTTMNQVGQVRVRGWNPKEKSAVVAQAAVGAETTTMAGATSGPAAVNAAFGETESASVTRPVLTQAEADQIATGRFNELALDYIQGEGACIGRTDLRAGAVVRMEGLGQRFNGLYYVTSATHTYAPAHGYRTMFTVRRNAA